jgi:hypothetical protein
VSQTFYSNCGVVSLNSSTSSTNANVWGSGYVTVMNAQMGGGTGGNTCWPPMGGSPPPDAPSGVREPRRPLPAAPAAAAALDPQES